MVVRRPSDRKAQIIAAASELFQEKGYHNVSVAEVAAAVGITAPALYRHFRNKPDLLRSSVQEGLDSNSSLAFDAEDVEALLAAYAERSAGRQGLPLLWQREARYLPADERAVLRAQVHAIAERDAALIREARPELGEDDGLLLAWAVIAVFSSLDSLRAPPRRLLEPLLRELARRVVHVDLGATAASPPRSSAGSAGGLSVELVVPRRERLLIEAIRLFDERGYHAVNTDDIGAAAGTTGPNVYNHFDAKVDILVAAVTRAGERRYHVVENAVPGSASPQEVLAALLHAHIDLAINERHLIGLLAGEVDQLPARFRKEREHGHREYLNMWAQVLGEVRPGLSATEARISIGAALSVIESTVRIDRLRRRPDLAARLMEISSAVLLGPDGGS